MGKAQSKESSPAVESSRRRHLSADDLVASSLRSIEDDLLAAEEAADRVSPLVKSNNAITRSSRRTAPTDSTRSDTSATGSVGSESTPSLRDNLMRRQENRNPVIYYETIKVLGVGSMGSVSQVRKRSAVIGGSARSNFVLSIHGASGLCFSLPLIGNVLRACTGKDLGHRLKSGKDLFVDSTRSTNDVSGHESSNYESTDYEKASGGENGSKVLRKSSSTISYANKEIHYALKTIHLNMIENKTFVEELRNEIEILKTLDHPNIVRPIETFNYRSNTYIVMELCSGGDLYTRDPYTEEHALRIVCSILSAIEYMHARNIVHRDLKYENIMFCNNRLDSDVKVIDFGLSKQYFRDNPTLKEGVVGTFYSMAPEVIRGAYTSKADVWSLGVIAFMLLSSQMPFYGKDIDEVVHKIIQGKYDFKGRRWMRASTDARAFVADLLTVDQGQRPTATEALKYDWICRSIHNNSVHSSSERVRNDLRLAQASIEAFTEYSRLKKLALMIVAHTATSEEIGFLRNVFDQYDLNRNGKISYEEFRDALDEFGYSEAELLKMFAGCDLDGTGVVQYTEFLAATIESNGAINEKALAEAFDRIDSDDSGYISTGNLREILGEKVSSEHIEEIILEAENALSYMYSEAVKRKIISKPRKDHKISYEEFLALWNDDDKRIEALKKIEKRMANRLAPLGSIPEISVADDNGPLSDALSDVSSDAEVDPMSESQFREEKMMSIRRYADI